MHLSNALTQPRTTFLRTDLTFHAHTSACFCNKSSHYSLVITTCVYNYTMGYNLSQKQMLVLSQHNFQAFESFITQHHLLFHWANTTFLRTDIADAIFEIAYTTAHNANRLHRTKRHPITHLNRKDCPAVTSYAPIGQISLN